jgi:PIN domain nuclease of toxin-antitoxin system
LSVDPVTFQDACLGSGANVLPISDAHVIESRQLPDIHQDPFDRLLIALARIEKGSYGTCDDCGDAILFERLAASPAATRCLPCETRVEHFVLRAPRL